MFWLRKFVRGGLSKKNQEDWMKAILSVKNTNKEKYVSLYLKWILKNEGVVDVQCYTSPMVQDDLQKKVYQAVKKGNTEIVKILAPLTDNPNAQNPNNRKTPSLVAKNPEIRRILRSWIWNCSK